ncbi:MAG: hypothetical protein KDA89_18740, partial [Planctomycetaceae bacterium]|nr:hypothetical protein [Planctomycetaceae bacterium]
MNFGETLVIGGLISHREEGSTSKVPFFGELPWIGAAFGRKQYTDAETELVILITPEYVAPMSPEQIPPGGPGLQTDAPTDHELFFQNLLEVPRVGSECDATFNCMECSQHGHCPQHPNGLFGGFGVGGNQGYCGPNGSPGAGCTDGAGGTIYEPMMISPTSRSKPADPPVAAANVSSGAVISPTPERQQKNQPTNEASNIPQSDNSGGTIEPISAKQPVVRSPKRPQKTGLISPLMR